MATAVALAWGMSSSASANSSSSNSPLASIAAGKPLTKGLSAVVVPKLLGAAYFTVAVSA
jgi:hypothetical protein